MAFDITTWKNQLKSHLPGWQSRMKAAGVKSAYYFIAACAFLPIAQAFQSGNIEPFAFTAIASGLGANLLANIVQHWRDEASAAVQLEQAVQNDPELQTRLDALLENLDAIKVAELTLGDTDKAWFTETIQSELKAINSSVRYKATLTGSGAIAQGNGTIALGAGASYIGGNYTVNNHPDPEAEKRQQALETYLNRLRRACLFLPLAAMGGDESAESDVTLDKVYIGLNTTSRKDDQDEPSPDRMAGFDRDDEKKKSLSAIEAAGQSPRLALLGDPGGGKSTFVKNLLALQANTCMGKEAPLEGFEANLVPVLVILRDLAPRLAALKVEELPAQKRDELLVATVWEQILADLGGECAAFAAGLQAALQNGECLLALDGLDEVPQDLRVHVRHTVDALLKHYNLRRIIVTCRVRSYVGQAVLPQFTSRVLAPFNREQIGNFVQGWYNTQRDLGRISASQAKDRMQDLSSAALAADLRELSSNPMLLTTMAIIHQREVGLPRERVRLYHLAVEVLLRRWQKHKVGDAALAEFLKNDLKLRAAMEALAYAAHRASAKSGESGTLLRKDAIELLEKAEHLGDLRLAGEFLDYVDQRAGLLLGHGGELHKPTAYSFPHRTFQEYLAGAYLAGQRDRVRTFMSHAADGDSWDLAAQLAFEELFYNRRAGNELLDLAYQLGAAFKIGEQHERAFLWAGQITALVGRDAVERDSHPSGGAAYLEKLLPGLVEILSGGLRPLERAEAGRALAKLGDPRPDALICERMDFCHIPAGKFLFGEGKAQKKIQLAEYWAGKYPVTNAQFAEFIAAKGYEDSAYWQEALKENYWSDAGFKGRYDDKLRTAPVDFGEPYSLPNHPVVGISWYEAQAFTRWLSEQLAVISSQWTVTGGERTFRDHVKLGKLQAALPTEEQWEKATRGTDGRSYPWPGEFDPNKANTFESGICTTTAVGCFPGGQSLYGLLDASGNVWEWTASAYDKSSYVLRGGTFGDLAVGARCAIRLRGLPDDGDGYLGFRVIVISPLLPSRS